MLLIFDCDGVLVDSMRLHNEIESELYRELGINLSPDELGRRFAGISQAEEFRILTQETGIHIPEEAGLQLDQRKEKIFAERLKTIPGIHTTLEKLQHIPRCVASGTRQHRLKHMLEITNLTHHFTPHVYSADMVAKGKPHPDLFLHAAKQVGHDPITCVVIEDAVAGVQAGRAAGMRVFGFTGGSHCDKDLGDRLTKAGAELVFSDMIELPNLIAS